MHGRRRPARGPASPGSSCRGQLQRPACQLCSSPPWCAPTRHLLVVCVNLWRPRRTSGVHPACFGAPGTKGTEARPCKEIRPRTFCGQLHLQLLRPRLLVIRHVCAARGEQGPLVLWIGGRGDVAGGTNRGGSGLSAWGISRAMLKASPEHPAGPSTHTQGILLSSFPSFCLSFFLHPPPPSTLACSPPSPSHLTQPPRRHAG